MRVQRTLEPANPAADRRPWKKLASFGLSLAMMMQILSPTWAAPAAEASPSPAVIAPATSPAPAAPEASPTPTPTPTPTPRPAPTVSVPKGTETAADLRLRMTSLYDEFGLLAWSAILGANGGKKGESMFKDAISALEQNANNLGRLYGQIYGDRAGSDFAALWKKQISGLVEYAQATAKKNTAAQETAAKFLVDVFPNQMAGFLTPLSRGAQSLEATAGAIREYMKGLKATADAQAVRDFNNSYRALDTVYGILGQMGHDQADAAVRAFPTRYIGNLDLPAVDLRVRLYSLFGQQMFTLAMANRANFASNIDEYYALFARSDLSTDQINKQLASYAGSDFANQFTGVWKKYIASLQDYEKACEAKDSTMRKRVKGDLTGHAVEITQLFFPSAPSRAVPPPKKGSKKPKAPPPPPFQKDVQKFFDASVSVIDDETRGRTPFGALENGWRGMRVFTDSMTAQIVNRFGDKPQPPPDSK